MPYPEKLYSLQQTPKERLLLFILAAVQFTHCLDFSIILPLGNDLMREFNILPKQFGLLAAAYSGTAAVGSLAAAFVMDRIPRRGALLVLYAGFVVFTFGCALAPTFGWLLLARALTGLFGGVAGCVVGAMVADVVPPARRGRGMAILALAFPLAQVVGMPAGLWFSRISWHAPFWFLGAIGVVVLAVAFFALPAVSSVRATVPPAQQMREILTHPVHLRAFALAAMLLFSGALVAPYMPMAMERNGGLAREDLMLVYFVGGSVVFFTSQFFGWLTDRFDKLRVLCGISVFTIATVVAITRWVNAPLALTLALTTLFFVTMSGRFAPAMSMVSISVEARYRGGFMSVVGAMQLGSASLAHLTSGAMITIPEAGKDGPLVGYDNVGLLSAAMFGVTLVLAAWLRKAVPWASDNTIKPPADRVEG